MERFIGKIGYANTTETSDDTFEESFTERTYTFQKERLKQSNNNGSTVNSETKITMEVSVLTDAFVQSRWSDARYITYMGKKWKIESADPGAWPRLALSIGGLYNT